MFKLIKYEYRKDLVLYIVLFAVLLVLEAYLLFGILSGQDAHLAISIVLFVLGASAGILFIFIMGVVSYAREINSKYSYMTFMTPSSAFQVVGAKYLSLFFATALASGLYVFFIYLDYRLVALKYGDVIDTMKMLEDVLSIMGINANSILIALLASLFLEWIGIFVTVSYAYLAITLSATILANKKGKGWLAVGLFVAIYIITRIILHYLPTFDFGNETLMEIMAGSWLQYLFELIVIIGTFFGVSILLNKKVSL